MWPGLRDRSCSDIESEYPKITPLSTISHSIRNPAPSVLRQRITGAAENKPLSPLLSGFRTLAMSEKNQDMFFRDFLQSERFQSFFAGGVAQDILISGLLALAAAILIYALRRVLSRYIEETDRRYRVSKIAGRLLGLFTALAILYVWSSGQGPGPTTILTVVGAGLAIALRDVLLSFVAWIHMLIRAPYKSGDRIEVNGLRGDVIDIRPLHSSMMETGGWLDGDQSTGRIVHFPNNWFYQYGVFNYTQGFRFVWNEIPFTVTFRSDWKAARDILLKLASEATESVEQQAREEIQRMSREYFVYYEVLTPFVYVRVTQNGIRLSLRHLTEARRRRHTEHTLTMRILEAFREHGDIELSYMMIGYETSGESGRNKTTLL